MGRQPMIAIYARTSKENSYQHNDSNAPIEQQIKEGIAFAERKGLPYAIYADRGITGAMVKDIRDDDPFENRPQFSNLLEDVSKGKIQIVWVWEQSRLIRDNAGTAANYIYSIFIKNKVQLYVKDTYFDLNNDQTFFIANLLSLIAGYERSLIRARTMRGLHTSIDSGKRTFGWMFGYKKTTRNAKGNFQFEVVESEIEQMRTAFKMYLEGKSLRAIYNVVFNDRKTSQIDRFLSHYQYTSFDLNVAGLALLHKYEETGNPQTLAELSKADYWVKSTAYTVQIISIEDWLKVKERLVRNHLQNALKIEDKKRTAGMSLATGIPVCSGCGMPYYFHIQHSKGKEYKYYLHLKGSRYKKCSAKPQSLNIDQIDNVLEFWFMYWLLVFDRNNETINEELKLKEITRKQILEQIRAFKNQITQKMKAKDTLEKALTADSITTAQVLAISSQIANLDEETQRVTILLNDKNAELEDLNKEMEKSELELNYSTLDDTVWEFLVRGKIGNFFRKMGRDDGDEMTRNAWRRDQLIRVLGNTKVKIKGDSILINKENIKFEFNYKNTDFQNLTRKVYDAFGAGIGKKEFVESPKVKGYADFNFNHFHLFIMNLTPIKTLVMKNNDKADEIVVMI